MQNKMSPNCLKSLLKLIGTLSRAGMEAGNAGDFEKAFMNLKDALSYTRELDKKCLEAKLLNNLGLLYTMNGAWEQALFHFERSLTIVTDHYGTDNILYKTLQKNMGYLLTLDVAAA